MFMFILASTPWSIIFNQLFPNIFFFFFSQNSASMLVLTHSAFLSEIFISFPASTVWTVHNVALTHVLWDPGSQQCFFDIYFFPGLFSFFCCFSSHVAFVLSFSSSLAMSQTNTYFEAPIISMQIHLWKRKSSTSEFNIKNEDWKKKKKKKMSE